MRCHSFRGIFRAAAPVRTRRHGRTILARFVGWCALGVTVAPTVAAQTRDGMRAATPPLSASSTALLAGASTATVGTRAIAVSAAAADDSLLGHALRGVPPDVRNGRYILVHLNARRLWYVDRDTVRFVADVGVGKDTPPSASASPSRHATPRARFTVLRKDSMPMWVPPDWYFEELAATTGRSLRSLRRGDTLRTRDGSRIYVDGPDVMRRPATGGMEPVALTDSAGGRRELVVDGSIIVPPFGTTQRRYPGVLGPRRLAFRDGYAIHGTDHPETIGLAASHGCLRMRTEDVLVLYGLVTVGTPVFVW